MKLSNNALNFLLAQYRAIFKRAYVKGLASAVLLTAGLAAGATQSAAATAIEAGGSTWADAKNVVEVSTADVVFSGEATRFYNNLTITNSGTLSIQYDTTGNDKDSKALIIKDTMTVAGTLNVGNATSGGMILGWNAGVQGGTPDADHATGGLVVNNGGKLNVTAKDTSTFASIQLDRVTLESGSTTVLSGTSGDTWNIGKGAQILAGYAPDSDSNFVIEEGATVTMKSQSMLGVGFSYDANRSAELKIDGTVNLQGTAGNGGLAMIYANDVYKFGSNEGWEDQSLNSHIVIGETGEIIVSGNGMISSPETAINGGTINVQSGTLLLNGHFQDLQSSTISGGTALSSTNAAAGQFTVTDGSINIATGATLTVGSGKYEHDDERTTDVNESGAMTTLDIQSGELTGAGTLQVLGALKVSNQTLQTFVGSTNNGKVNTSGGSSVIEFKDATDLAQYTFSGGDSADFKVEGKTTFKGDNLTVSDLLTKAANQGTDVASNIVIEATDLTLGNDEYSGTGSLNFSGATARNLTLQGSGNTFTLADAVTVAAIDEVDNPFLTEEGKLQVAADGQLNLEDKTTITGGDTKGLIIAAGNFESNADVTIKSGALTVGNQTTDTAEGHGVDASLALTGKLTLDNSTGANKITIAGNGSQSIKTDDVANTLTRYATSTLDLTDARVDITRGDNNTTFNVNGHGELLLSTNAFNSIINNVANADTAKSGAEVVVSGGGYVYVEGSIQDYTGSKALDVAKLTSGSATGTDRIHFSGDGAGTLEARDTIWLAANSDSATLNIGSGELKAQTFRLDGFGTTADNKTTYAAFKVESGILTAGARVESSHDNAIQLGNGTNGATLNLGYIEANEDEWGQKTGTYTTSSATGSVDTDLVLSGGADANKSTLKVWYGDWSAKDITVTNGTVTVGDTTPRYDADDNEVVYNASLTGNKLALNAGATATVNSNGKATFNELTMTAGTLKVNGEMTVNGRHVAAIADVLTFDQLKNHDIITNH